jgi:hypothetical protein
MTIIYNTAIHPERTVLFSSRIMGYQRESGFRAGETSSLIPPPGQTKVWGTGFEIA